MENINEIKKDIVELELTNKEAIEKLEADITDYVQSIELITYIPEDSLVNDIKKVL